MQRIVQLINDAVKQKQFSAAALAVGTKKSVLMQQTWGTTQFQQGAEVSGETLFDIASLSKITVTTPLMLKLVENGQVCLQDTLKQYFTCPPDKADITVFHLLTHTSGLAAHIPLWQQGILPQNAADCILASTLEGKPGAQVQYSCMGFILLGKIIEQVTCLPLDTAARQLIFTPLGMGQTCYGPCQNAATTEKDENGNWLCGVVHDENARFLGGVSGNAGVFSTIGDMERFAQMLACGGGGFLSAAAMRTATQNHTPGCAENRGLGFKLAGGENDFFGDLLTPASFGHTGFTGTSLVIQPETGLYVVLLTNRVHPTRDAVNLTRLRRTLHNCAAAYAEEM